MKTELSVEIDRPIEEVFDYIHNNLPKWSTSIISDTVIREQNQGGYGTTFQIVTEEGGRRMEFTGEVTGWSPPRSSRSYLTGDSFDVDVEHELKTLSRGGTLVTQRSSVIPKSLFMRLMVFFFGWAMRGVGKRALEKDFLNLKRLLESQS